MVAQQMNTVQVHKPIPVRQDKLQRFRMTIDDQVRHQMICDVAYRLAEERGFQNGDPVHDWLEAEQEVDLQLGVSR